MDQNAIDEDDEEEEEAVDTEMENGTNDGGGITESEAMDEDDVVPAKKSKVIRAEPVDGLWSCEVSECGRAFNSVRSASPRLDRSDSDYVLTSSVLLG